MQVSMQHPPTSAASTLVERASGPSLMINKYTRKLFGVLLETPLLQMYLYGPSIGGYGFWEGKPLHMICQDLTSVSSEHWEQHPYICEELILHKFDALLVCVYFIVYIIVTRFVVLCVWRGLWITITGWRHRSNLLKTEAEYNHWYRNTPLAYCHAAVQQSHQKTHPRSGTVKQSYTACSNPD
jgi:hypothetical protein